jgi:hypothetical protein
MADSPHEYRPILLLSTAAEKLLQKHNCIPVPAGQKEEV